jgi:hypothetical protein
MHLVRDVLDNRLVDRNGRAMGRVDGIVLTIRDGGQPELSQLETGFPTLACRLHPRLGRWVTALGRRFGLRGGRTLRFPWSRVTHAGLDVQLDVDVDRTEALAWERWVRDRFTRHLPGAR